jgi:peptide/nickel transport system ATP-binding protein
VQDLRVHYTTDRGIVHAVERASFDVPEGQVVGVVGESGCGKTTLARSIIRVMEKNAAIVGGRMQFGDKDLVRLSEVEIRRLRWRDIAFIPQSAMNSLDPVYRVGAQLVEVLVDRGGLNRRKARDRAEELFDMVDLDSHRLRDYPHQFSGGMRQRAAIALALALNPKLVIADEPVTALDVIVQRQVLDVFKSLQNRLGVSVILITHDISVIAYTCDQVVVMYAGEVVESGPTAKVLSAPVHPYTMGLYKAFPDLQGSGDTLVPIEGSPPDLLDPPAGCRFADRCPFAKPVCEEAGLVLEDVAPGHRAACRRLAEAEDLRGKAGEAATWQRS